MYDASTLESNATYAAILEFDQGITIPFSFHNVPVSTQKKTQAILMVAE